MAVFLRTSWTAGLLVVAATIPIFLGRVDAVPLVTSDGEKKKPDAGLPVFGSASVFLSEGDFGAVPLSALSLIQDDPSQVKAAASDTLRDILQKNVGLTGQESLLPIAAQPIRIDKQQRAHIRYRQFIDGLPLEGASISIHFDTRTGKVLAANGEVHTISAVVSNHSEVESPLECVAAMETALTEYMTQTSSASSGGAGAWLDECQVAAVQGRDGMPYRAYKRSYGYQPETYHTSVGDAGENVSLLVESLPYQLDLLFADRMSGKLVAVHPKVVGSRTMTTYHCDWETVNPPDPDQCRVVTNSSAKVDTFDPPLDDAHNNAVDVYDFYARHFARLGMDGNDLKIKTLAHYGSGYNNAFFSSRFGGVLVYGDGDGIQYSHWGQFDVVAHEFSHGVTHFTSDLVYEYESGAINEAFSDIMGAAADRLVKRKSTVDVWRVSEDLDLLNRVGIRNMANPPDFFHPDHYANRYIFTDDNGGVHINSGIMNKAFYLMVAGDTHPLSGVDVPALSPDFDTSIKQGATIFYDANTMCLSASSDFFVMRECTLLFASSAQRPTVQKAWDAVGVKSFLPLTPGVTYSDLSMPLSHEVQIFQLDQTVDKGESVTCFVRADDGDPDLSVRFGRRPNLYPNFAVENDCWAFDADLDDSCTTGAAPAPHTQVFVAVEAYWATSGIELTCTINGATPTPQPTLLATLPPTRPPTKRPTTPCKPLRAKCTTRSQCCRYKTATACDGPNASSRVCKACKARRAACNRSSECCFGLSCRSRRCG